jgi:DHA1 family bicyclomycin/chloramphenicol resistance-like MFS transporter
MTQRTLHVTPSPGSPSLTPGTAGFTVVLSMAMAGTALAIDTMLPAFPEIRGALGLEADSTAVAGLVTAFLIGQGVGLLPAGLLADRFGRRPVMWGGIAIYVVAAVASALAPTLELMIVARLIWGIGAAGPRVAATAMIRDSFEGAEMAKQMSTIMAVFLIIPTIAPTIGAGLVAVGPWQLVFWICAIYAGGVLVVSTRLPATMKASSAPTATSVRELWENIGTVFTTPGTYGYLLATIGLFASFITYLASSEIIVDEVFGLAEWFPFIFGAISAVMAAVMIINRQIVVRVGLDRMMHVMSRALIVVAGGFVVLSLLTGGAPPFALFFLAVTFVIACQQLLAPNINAAAMRPLGAVAGTAAAIFGMVPMIVGSLLGSLIDRSFDGTVTPIAVGMAACAILAAVGVAWANHATPQGALGPSN